MPFGIVLPSDVGILAWTPGIGDPTPIGWITVAAYALAAGSCWRARNVALRVRAAAPTSRAATLWTLLTVGLVALGVNKQLDIQTAVTEVGRAFVQARGWQESKGTIQLAFVATVALVAAGLSAWLFVLARREGRGVLVSVLGCAALAAFVAIRAASIHHVDRWLGTRLVGTTVNALLELGGIALVAAGAWVYSSRTATSASS